MNKNHILTLLLFFIIILSANVVSAEIQEVSNVDMTDEIIDNADETSVVKYNPNDLNKNQKTDYKTDSIGTIDSAEEDNMMENEDYDIKVTDYFEEILYYYNYLNINGTTTINMVLPEYDSINLDYDNKVRELIINGNDTVITGNINVNIGNNSIVTINSITLNGTVNIVNNGTLYLNNVSFMNNDVSTYLIENNKNLYMNDCLFMDINYGIIDNRNIVSINNSQISRISSNLQDSPLMKNQGKILIENTVLSDNVMTSFINDTNDYDFANEETEYYKVAEILIINSQLNYSSHYLNPLMQAKKITIINSSLNNIKLEYSEEDSTDLVADEIIMLDNYLNAVNINSYSENFISINNNDENGLWNETSDIDVEETYAKTAEYVETFLADDVIIVYKPHSIETKIIFDNIEEAVYGEDLTVTGQLIDVDGNSLNDTPIIISSNFTQPFETTTDDEGKYSYTFQITQMGENYLTVEFAGNDSYKQSINTTTFNVTRKASIITLDDIMDVQYTDYVTITGKYTDIDNKNLRYTPIIITVNGVRYVNDTNAYGIFTFTFRTNKLGENNVDVTYQGNSRYKGANNSTTFIVTRKDTHFIFNIPAQVQYTDNITIIGKYADTNGINLRYTPITLTVNNKKYSLTTNDTGDFTLTMKATNLGTNNVSASYPGNNRYNKCETNITFDVVRKDTVFMVDVPSEVQYTDNISIVGKYLDSNGVNLRYTPITLIINNVKNTITTDGVGGFKYTMKATNLGVNNVSVFYPGNNRYNKSEKNITFEVVRKGTFFTLNKILTVEYGDNVNITGCYADINSNNLRYTPINLEVNKKEFVVYTDSYGKFSFLIKAENIGTNNVTVSYGGNARYSPANLTTTFIVNRKSTQFTLNKISQKSYSDEVIITGKYTDANKNNLRYTPVKLVVNSKEYSITTNAYGEFSLTIKATTVGKNNVTVSYPGNTRYAGASSNLSFNVVPKTTNITIQLSQKQPKTNITLEGNLTDKDGLSLRYTPLTINLNGTKTTVTTDVNGYFKFLFLPTKAGSYNLTVSYNGNSRYAATSVSKTFKIIKS